MVLLALVIVLYVETSCQVTMLPLILLAIFEGFFYVLQSDLDGDAVCGYEQTHLLTCQLVMCCYADHRG